MNRENLEGANLPQAEWSPPNGDLSFDEMFGGAGDGSSDVVQVEEAASEAIEQTPAQTDDQQTPASQTPNVTQKTLKQDPETGYFLQDGDVVYKTAADAIAGLREKNKNIENLRSMVAAVTGTDPLKKGSNLQPQAEVSYLADANRYAQDLERAAEHGQRTRDWSLYRDVQAKFNRELIQQTVGQYAPMVQEQSQRYAASSAIDAVTNDIPEFRDFYGSEVYHQALDARPKLKAAVEFAEKNAMRADLEELYKSTWDARTTLKLPELLKQPNPSNSTNTTRMPMGRASLTPPKVVGERLPNTSAPSLNTSAGRKALIADLESRGIHEKVF